MWISKCNNDGSYGNSGRGASKRTTKKTPGKTLLIIKLWCFKGEQWCLKEGFAWVPGGFQRVSGRARIYVMGFSWGFSDAHRCLQVVSGVKQEVPCGLRGKVHRYSKGFPYLFIYLLTRFLFQSSSWNSRIDFPPEERTHILGVWRECDSIPGPRRDIRQILSHIFSRISFQILSEVCSGCWVIRIRFKIIPEVSPKTLNDSKWLQPKPFRNYYR